MLHGGSILSDSAPPFFFASGQLSVLPVRIHSERRPIRAAFVPAVPDDSPSSQGGSRKDTAQSNMGGATRNTDSVASVRDKEWRVYAKEHWRKENESALMKHEPLPLPITFPGSTPVPEDVEKMKNCNPEIKDCRDVMYQWTGKCIRCQGTGEVSFYRKKGREVIIKCIACLGFVSNILSVLLSLEGWCNGLYIGLSAKEIPGFNPTGLHYLTDLAIFWTKSMNAMSRR